MDLIDESNEVPASTSLPANAPVPVVQRVRWSRPHKRVLVHDPMEIFSKENRCDLAGISFGTFFYDHTASTTPNTASPYVVWEKRCVVQYWLLAVPLTMLSAFLLFLKPRKSNPTTFYGIRDEQ